MLRRSVVLEVSGWGLAVSLGTVLCLGGCGRQPESGAEEPLRGRELRASEARGQRVGTSAALYLRLSNDGPSDLWLHSASLDAVDEAMRQTVEVGLHETVDDDGVLRMRAADGWLLPAGGDLELTPGGRHLMVTGLAADQVSPSLTVELMLGSSVPLGMTSDRAPDASPSSAFELVVEFPLETPGASEHLQHH